MFKVTAGLIIVLGLWVGVEIMNEGPSKAFGGLFSSILTDSPTTTTKTIEDTGTVQRAGNAAARARDRADERRERIFNQ